MRQTLFLSVHNRNFNATLLSFVLTQTPPYSKWYVRSANTKLMRMIDYECRIQKLQRSSLQKLSRFIDFLAIPHWQHEIPIDYCVVFYLGPW